MPLKVFRAGSIAESILLWSIVTVPGRGRWMGRVGCRGASTVRTKSESRPRPRTRYRAQYRRLPNVLECLERPPQGNAKAIQTISLYKRCVYHKGSRPVAQGPWLASPMRLPLRGQCIQGVSTFRGNRETRQSSGKLCASLHAEPVPALR